MQNLQQNLFFYFHTCHVWLPGVEWRISVFHLVHILRMWPVGCHCQFDTAHRDPENATGANNHKDVKVKITAECEDALFYAVLIKRVCDVMKVLCLQ